MKKIVIFMMIIITTTACCSNSIYAVTLNEPVTDNVENIEVVGDDTETFQADVIEEYTEAITTRKSFKVTFIDKVRNKKIVKEVLENERVSSVEVSDKGIFIKQGRYKYFSYWKNENNKRFDFTTPITSDVTLYAEYYIDVIDEQNPAEYTVYFDTQGGTSVESQIIENGLIKEPNAPYMEGYIFLGWFTEPQNGEKWDFAKDNVNGDMTLYAHWAKEDTYYLISPKTGYDIGSVLSILLISVSIMGIYLYKIRKAIY